MTLDTIPGLASTVTVLLRNLLFIWIRPSIPVATSCVWESLTRQDKGGLQLSCLTSPSFLSFRLAGQVNWLLKQRRSTTRPTSLNQAHG